MNNLFNPPPGASFDEKGAPIDTPVEPSAAEVAAPVEIPDAPAAPEGPAEPAPEKKEETIPEIDWDAVLTERTGGRVKTWEELTAKITEEKAALTFANDESLKIYDYLKEGKVQDVLKLYNEQTRLAGIDKMSDADVVKLALEYKHGGRLTPEDLQEEIQSKYTLDKPEGPNADDYLDDDALAKAQKAYEKEVKRYEREQKALDRELKKEAGDSREYLSTFKKEIVLPDIHPTEPNTDPDPAAYEAAVAEQQKFRQEYLSSLEKSAAAFKEIPLKVNDEGVTFEGSYQIDDGERQALQKDLAEKNVFEDLLLSRYVKGDVYDTNQLMEDLYWLNNKHKIVASAVKQALSKGKLDMIKESKNVDLNGQHRENFTPDEMAAQKEFARNFFQAR